MGLVRWVNGWADRLIETSGWRRHPRSKRLQLMVVPWVFGIVGAFALYVIFDSPVLVYLLYGGFAISSGVFIWALVTESRAIMRLAVWLALVTLVAMLALQVALLVG